MLIFFSAKEPKFFSYWIDVNQCQRHENDVRDHFNPKWDVDFFHHSKSRNRQEQKGNSKVLIVNAQCIIEKVGVAQNAECNRTRSTNNEAIFHTFLPSIYDHLNNSDTYPKSQFYMDLSLVCKPHSMALLHFYSNSLYILN